VSSVAKQKKIKKNRRKSNKTEKHDENCKKKD